MRAGRWAWATAALLSLAGCTASATRPATGAAALQPAAPCADEDDWNEATAPRHVYGNTWWVGSCGISAILVTSPDGHILIDGATALAADGIARSIEASGHRLQDVRVILVTHEHLDHAGGIARLQQLTGARVLARAPALAVLRTGANTREDPQLQQLRPFPAVPAAQPVADGAEVRLGPLAVRVHATPGHAPGGTSFSWRSCEGTACRQLVYADSVSAISDGSYRFLDHPDYVAAFRDGMRELAGIAPCDILLTPHPSASGLWPRLRGEAPMASPAGACRDYAGTGLRNLETRLQKEQRGELP